ncbi:ABC transporter substrate-binding protein [Sulfolobus acidocaldarius SUSAZ]|nr:ABC transporter substrate-binding protein [Sulfolobus acidocaldarius SUSAZ]
MKKTGKRSKRGISRTIIAVIVVVVIIIAAVAAYFLMTSRSSSSIQAVALAPTSFVILQGTPENFTVYNTQPNAIITVNFGDGVIKNFTATGTSTSFSYTYQYPGHYLVLINEYVNNKLVSTTNSSLLPITVEANIPSNEAGIASVPLITFNTTKNPTAPFFKAGETAYFYAGFLQPPTGQNMTIQSYTWSFGNGQTLTIKANSSTLLPTINPVNITYNSPGIYVVKLTLTTLNVSSGEAYNFSTLYTVAVGPYAQFKFSGNVPNPGTITVAENVPGGPYSFDPDIDYESVGFEVISNIIGTLLIYNGSSTTSFIPFIAAQIPTVQNGGINSNYTTYTFKIRSGLYFADGSPITAYDVWYSIVRALLTVGGTPGTGTWILAQYLIPGATIGVPVVSSSNPTQGFQEIMNAVTYDNATNTVTFHLYKSTPPNLFFTAIADPLTAGILSAKWLESVGDGITFTPQGFLAYENTSIEGHYNTQVENNPLASGPYMIKQYVPGQYVVLTPNPYFPGVPGIPKPNDTVVIEWVKDPQTAYNLFTSGQADIVTGLPTNYFASLKPLVAQGQASIYQFPTLSEFFFVFNLNISTSGLKQLGPNYNIPPNYFANLYVREAFAYAFNYTNYIENILGNAKYGFDFGEPYAGVIIKGLPYYTPPSEFTGVPTFNLTYAKQLLIQSGVYNESVYFPIIVPSGDTVDYAGVQMFAQAMQQIDPNIKIEPLYEPFSTIIGLQVPGQNPMPMYYLGWIADYPYPSDFVDAMYKENGTYPAPDGWYVSYLQQLGYTNEAQMYQQLNNLIIQADSATNSTQAALLYKQVEQTAINLYMYIYLDQPNAFWVVKPYMNGYNGQISYEENPQIGGAGDSLYFWWVKG